MFKMHSISDTLKIKQYTGYNVGVYNILFLLPIIQPSSFIY